MVFVRNVARLVRPVVLGRCLIPRSSSCPGLSVASFPSIISRRNNHSAMEGETLKANTSFITDSVSFSNPVSVEPTDESNALSGVPTEKLIESFRGLLKQGQLASMSSFEEIFKALSDNRDFPTGFELIKEMRATNLKPSSIIYSYVARSGRRVLKARELRILFGEEITRNQYNNNQADEATSHSTVESILFSSIKELLELMRIDGAELTQFFYDDLAFGLAMNHQGGLLINIAVAMEKRGMQPSTYFYNKMLHTLPRCGLVDRADVLFSRMVLNNLADQSSYTVRIGSLVYLGRVSEAENCFKDMSKLYGANEVACNTIINGYLNERRLDDALEVLDMMKGNPQCRPNNITGNTFVSYYYNTGDLVSAPAVLEYFATAINYPSQPRDYANLFKLFARNDQIRAQKMLEGLKEKHRLFDVEVYNAVLHSVSDRVIPFSFRQKIAQILVPEPISIEGDSLAALCINSSMEFRQIVAKMEKEGISPNGVTYDLILKSLRARNDNDAAIQAFRRIPIGLIQNTHRNHYLASMISKGEAEEIKELVRNMSDRRQPIFDFNLTSLSQLGIDLNTYRVRIPVRRQQSFQSTTLAEN